MIGFLVLLFPVLLMLFVLGMERLEEPLTRVAVERDVEEFLDHAEPAELDSFLREGSVTAIRRFRLRVRFGAGSGRRRPAERGRTRR